MVGGNIKGIAGFINGSRLVVDAARVEPDVVAGWLLTGSYDIKVESVKFVQVIAEELDTGLVRCVRNDHGIGIEIEISMAPFSADGLGDDGCGWRCRRWLGGGEATDGAQRGQYGEKS